MAAKMSPLIIGAPTIGPGSSPEPKTEPPQDPILSPPSHPHPFDDAQWDHSICAESALDTSSLDLIRVQTVAHNMYIGEMQKLRREIAKQEKQKRLLTQQQRILSYREKITREADEELQEKSRLLKEAFEQRVTEASTALDLRFAAEDQKRLAEVAKRNEQQQSVLKRQAEKAQLNSYLDQIQTAQKAIREGLDSYNAQLSDCSPDLRTALKERFDPSLSAAIPQRVEIRNPALEAAKWQEARQLVDGLVQLVVQELQTAARNAQMAKNAEIAAAAAAAAAQASKPQPLPPPPPPTPTPLLPSDTTDTPSDVVSLFISPLGQSTYNELEQFNRDYEASLAPLLTDPAHSKLVRNAKMLVRSSLSQVSKTTLDEVFGKICSLLSGNRVQMTARSSFSAADHPLGLRFCTWQLADTVIDDNFASQANMPEYAKVIVWLAHRFPDFARLVRFFLYRKYPTTVPYFIPKFRGQSSEEFLALRGYKAGEETELFLGRVAAITKLFATILKTPPREGETHLFGLQTGWQWLADVLNLEPEQKVTVMIVTKFLEEVGEHLHVAYGGQFKRLMAVLKGPYLTVLRQSQQDVSYVAQLELLLEEKGW